MKRLLPLLLAGTLASGCTTYTTLQRASTLGQGKLQFALEPGALIVEGATASRADLSLRYGVSESMDVGGRFGVGGIDFFGKFRLSPPGSSVIFSVVPTAGLISFGDLGLLNLSLPLLIGFPVGDNEFVIGPKVHNMLGFAGDSGNTTGINVLMAGSTVGFALKAGGVTLMPEVAVMYPVVGTISSAVGSQTSTAENATALVQVSVGVLFGGD